MAEGAAVLVLEEYEHAIARGAEIIAEICGYGNTCDAYHVTAPRPDGSTQAAAVRQALEEGGYTSEDVLYINAHGTGTSLNDPAETMAFKLALGDDVEDIFRRISGNMFVLFRKIRTVKPCDLQ